MLYDIYELLPSGHKVFTGFSHPTESDALAHARQLGENFIVEVYEFGYKIEKARPTLRR